MANENPQSSYYSPFYLKHKYTNKNATIQNNTNKNLQNQLSSFTNLESGDFGAAATTLTAAAVQAMTKIALKVSKR